MKHNKSLDKSKEWTVFGSLVQIEDNHMIRKVSLNIHKDTETDFC